MYSKWKTNPSRFLAMTGYTHELFLELLPHFEHAHQTYLSKYNLKGKHRNNSRKFVLYQSSPLPTIEDRLIFILSFKKLNLIQEAQAAMFDMTQTQCNEFIHGLTTILEIALSDAEAMPATNEKQLIDILSIEDETNETLIHDGTEREIPRPKDSEEQKDNYSGKKKKHTLKNAVIINALCCVLFVSVTVNGSMHDKKIADLHYANAFAQLKKIITLWQDSGYQGFAPENVKTEQGTKKPKNQELTTEQKEMNKLISSFRVRVEHAIGSIKRYRIVKDECRLRKNRYPYNVFAICAGLHNFRLKFMAFKYPVIKTI